MPESSPYRELHCPKCSWRELCSRQSMVGWLRKARKVRPDREPEPDILEELFLATTSQLTCPNCGGHGLVVTKAAEEDFDWPDVVPCASCSKPIPKERLEAIPGTTLCATCQQKAERGESVDQPDYCPRCGAPMEVRLSRSGGITRYVLACTGNPPCRSS